MLFVDFLLLSLDILLTISRRRVLRRPIFLWEENIWIVVLF